MDFAAEMRMISAMADQRQRDAEEAEKMRRVEEKIAQHKAAKDWAAARFDTLIKDTRVAAANGSRQHRFKIAVFEEKRSPETDLRLEALLLLAEQHGFNAKADFTTDVPIGSDPMFPYTVYSTDLLVSW